MPQYLLSVYVSDEEMAKFTPEVMEQAFKDVDVVNDRIRAAGAWVYGNGLHPLSTATVVREQNGEVLTIDGPYLETKEYLGGFWIIEAADLDAALAWAREATVACKGPIEVRPFQDTPGD